MSKTKIIAIDDNVAALDVVEKYAQKVEWVSLKGLFTSPVEALEFLSNHDIDVVLVDVQMDSISGLELISIAKHQQNQYNIPVFIIISSYEKYAINGYELDIVDYLLKPFRFDRFLLALEKGRNRDWIKRKKNESVFIPNGTKNVRLDIDNVKYIQSSNHLIKVFFLNETSPLLLNQTIHNISRILEPHHFIQIHKQFVVNIQHVSLISNKVLVIDNEELPIGRNYRKQTLSSILK
jgi:DNA-binding LytR/AlgR family response regulator